MGVYIKGMEMPTSCSECAFCGYYGNKTHLCDINQQAINYDDMLENRRDDCPLVPVPEHGDLIDRDALRASIRESIDECHKWADEVDKDTMMYARISQSLGTFVECSLRAKAAPAIIPADKEGEDSGA